MRPGLGDSLNSGLTKAGYRRKRIKAMAHQTVAQIRLAGVEVECYDQIHFSLARGLPVANDDDFEDPRAQRQRPEPVEGAEIGMSLRAASFGLFGLSLLFAWGAGLFFLLARNTYDHAVHGEPLKGDKSPGFVLMFSLGLMCGAAVMARSTILRLRRRRRFLLGEDRVQLVEGRGDERRVVISIPYENIERMKCTRAFANVYSLEIALYDVGDSATYLPGVNVEENYRTHKCHFRVTDQFNEPMPKIYSQIQRLRKKITREWEEEYDV